MALLGLWAFTALLVPPVFLAIVWFLLCPRPTSVSLKARHVFITGGSSGIGLSIAQLAAVEGARISIIGRDLERLKAAHQSVLNYYYSKMRGKENDKKKAEISADGPPKVYFYSADVKSYQSIEEAVSAAVAESGPPDVLICSHGVAVPQTFEDTPLDTIYHMLDTNLKGNLHTIKAALPHMKNRKGSAGAPASISIVSSQAAQVSIYGYAAYAASKCGLRGLAEALQQELLPDNIRLSLIYPPDTETPGFIEENKTKPELTAKLSDMSRGKDPLDVARAAIKGLKAGQFTISCGFEGLLLSTATAGMTPQPSLFHGAIEILFMGLLRIVSLVILSGWSKTIKDWHQLHKK